MNASMLFRFLATLLVSLACAPTHAQRLDAVQNSALSGAGFGSAQQQRVTVSQPNGKPWVITEDMRVKVLGGYVRFERWWTGIAWVFAPAWSNLQFDASATTGLSSTSGSGGVSAVSNQPTEFFGGTGQLGGAGAYITNASATGSVVNKVTRNLAEFYSDANGSTYTAFTAPRYTIRPYGPNGATITGPISVSQELIVVGPGQFRLGDARWSPPNLMTWRWEDRAGDWVEYNANGRITRYGDRNNVTVNFRYVNDVLTAVLDHFGNEVLRFTYVAGRLTEVQDVPRAGETLPTRSVKYEYDAKGSINKVIDVMGNPMTYGYAADGKLNSVTDQENRTKRFEYGPSNRVSKYIDADGSETDYRYDYDRLKKQFYIRIDHPLVAAGRKTEEQWIDGDGLVVRRDTSGRPLGSLARQGRVDVRTDDRGQTIRFERDEYDNITRTTWPDGTSTSARYSPRHLGVLEQTDEAGVRTTYEYDVVGNLIKRTEAVGLPEQRVSEWTIDPANGHVLTETILGGSVTLPDSTSVTTQAATTRYEYTDSAGNRNVITDAEGHTTRITYSRLGLMTETMDARTNPWIRTYDARGLLLAATNPLNQTTRQGWNKVGDRIAQTDATDRTTRYTLDFKGRVVETIDALNNTARTTYDAAGRLTQETDFAGVVTKTYTYDRDGRALTQADALGNSVEFVYGEPNTGSGDLPIAIQFPTLTQATSYDARGRLVTATTTPKAEFNITNSPPLITRYEYDGVGNRTAVTDTANKVTRYSFDALRRNVTITDAANGVTRFAFDTRDNVVAVRDALNQQHRMQYDRRGQKTRETRPNGAAWQWTYDPVGNLATQTDAKNQLTTHVYDTANRLTRTAFGAKAVAFEYNPAGKLISYSDDDVTGTIGLDELHRKTSETVNYGAFNLTYRYRYAAQGTKSALVYPDGTEATYTHDPNRQLTSINLPQGAIALSYRDAYTRLETVMPGGTRSTMQMDALLRVASLNVTGPTQQTLLNYQYQYDTASNITQQQTQRGTNTFGYDDLYRLTTASYGNGLSSDSFTYDKVHNRLTDQTQPGAWSYNSNNQLINQGAGVSWSYDPNGQAIEKRAASTRTYGYNSANRLVEINDGGQAVARYAYDAFGRRIKKEITQGGGETIFYLYSDEGLLAEVDSQGRITTQYGFAPDGSWGTNPMYRLDKDLQGNNALSVYHTDHLGTPQQITNAQGQTLWSQRQRAFGEATVDAPSTITNNLRFAGQYFDQETGGHYNYFRDYDPRSGRYVQSDPIGLAGGSNTYAYVNNSPVRQIDSLGLASVTGSWIKPPRLNIEDWGIDSWEFVSPSWSWWGYLRFIRLHGHAAGYVNIDVKCRFQDDCSNVSEWEIHSRISISATGQYDVGPNLYAVGAGFVLGPWIGVSVNIVILGAVLLQTELHFLTLVNEKAGPLIAATLAHGPTAMCLGSQR